MFIKQYFKIDKIVVLIKMEEINPPNLSYCIKLYSAEIYSLNWSLFSLIDTKIFSNH